MVSKLKTRLFGVKHPWGTNTRVDKVVSVDNTANYAGALKIALLPKHSMGMLMTISSAGLYYRWGATSTSPQLLTKLEVLNPNASSVTFRLALMTTATGSPDAGQAFLAWDTPLAAYGIFSWTGSVPLIDRYIYAQGSIAGLILYLDVMMLDPK